MWRFTSPNTKSTHKSPHTHFRPDAWISAKSLTEHILSKISHTVNKGLTDLYLIPESSNGLTVASIRVKGRSGRDGVM